MKRWLTAILSGWLVLALLTGCGGAPVAPDPTPGETPGRVPGNTPGDAPASPPARTPGDAPAKALQSSAQRIMQPGATPDDLAALQAGNRRFAMDLYQALRTQPGNVMLSPYSISQALAMTYAGARGQTAVQMAQVLHFDLPPERLHPAFNRLDLDLQAAGGDLEGEKQKFQLNVANALWGQQDYSFLADYLDLLAINYGAGLRLVDFKTNPEAARQAINDWISQQTQKKIQNAVGPGVIHSDTRLALANAIYFNADWQTPFAAQKTRSAPFYLLDGSPVDVPLMSFEKAKSLAYAAGQGYQATVLPYAGNTASMVVIVPEAGNFDAFEAGLDAQKLADILSGLKAQPVALSLPKFTFEGDYQLSNTLANLGMPDAFSGQADFSGMDGQGGLSIGSVIHKTYVAVDEKGTEAAAATIITMEVTAMQDQPVRLVVDRPFLFLIRDDATNTILFLGRVVNPAAK